MIPAHASRGLTRDYSLLSPHFPITESVIIINESGTGNKDKVWITGRKLISRYCQWQVFYVLFIFCLGKREGRFLRQVFTVSRPSVKIIRDVTRGGNNF